MVARAECVERVGSLIAKQQQLLNLSLLVLQEGCAEFEGHQFASNLPDSVKTVVASMSLAGGQSVVTILEFSKKRGIPVRDCFPVARSAIETFINATYVLACGEPLAKQAIRHAQQKGYRDLEKTFGRGNYALHIVASHKPNLNEHDELKKALDEFTSIQGREKSWTDDSVPIRVEKIGRALGAIPASGLLGAYALIYADGSEIIHGSLYGIQLFYRGRGKAPETVTDFHAVTEGHLEGILFAIFMAQNSYLRAFCMVQDLQSLDRMLESLFQEFIQTIRETEKEKPNHTGEIVPRDSGTQGVR